MDCTHFQLSLKEFHSTLRREDNDSSNRFTKRTYYYKNNNKQYDLDCIKEKGVLPEAQTSVQYQSLLLLTTKAALMSYGLYTLAIVVDVVLYCLKE